MKRGQPLQRKTELRRTEFKRSTTSSLLRSSLPSHRNEPRRRTQRDDVPASIRRAVRERSGGLCECGCGRRAEHVHHRKLRSQGGRHELVNLLHLSNLCHSSAHANPERSYALGLIVHGWADPADVPVTRVSEVAA